MAIRASIEYRGLLARGLAPRGFRTVFLEAVRAALKDAGERWRDKTMKLHFGMPAIKRYGYSPRTIPYIRRKRRVKGHARPLEYTGASKARILGLKRPVTLKNSEGDFVVKVPFAAPKHFFYISEGGYQINLPKELTTITEAEVKEMILFIDERIGVYLTQMANSATRRVRRIA